MNNTRQTKTAIVVGASADIGAALCEDWLDKEWRVCGTYRTDSESVRHLRQRGGALLPCDLRNATEVDLTCDRIATIAPGWDVLILGPGAQEPVGLFSECDFDEWSRSITINFINQLRFIHRLLPLRNRSSAHAPNVLFFAGGGTNNAPLRYSAYTVSKIALIKMTELLAAEMPDVCFTILGPGWVKTKIHEATLKAGKLAGENYQRTIDKLAGDECTPMAQVVDCCNWLLDSEQKLVNGRNFSVVFDQWGSPELDRLLAEHSDMYKLRRHGNNF